MRDEVPDASFWVVATRADDVEPDLEPEVRVEQFGDLARHAKFSAPPGRSQQVSVDAALFEKEPRRVDVVVEAGDA